MISAIRDPYFRRTVLLAYAPVYTTVVVLCIILKGVMLAIADSIVEAKDGWRLFKGVW